MLSGHLSNQDEDEVENELVALRGQMEGPAVLPNAPTGALPEHKEEEGEPQPEEGQQKTQERTAIPA